MGSSWYDDTSGEFGGLLAAGEGRSTAKPTHSLLTGSRNKTALLALACTISPFKGRIKKDIEFFCNSGQHTQLHFRQHCKTYRKNKLFSLGEWAQLQPLSLSKEKSNFRHFFFPFLEARYGAKGPSLSIRTSRVALVFTPFFPHLPYMPAFPPKSCPDTSILPYRTLYISDIARILSLKGKEGVCLLVLGPPEETAVFSRFPHRQQQELSTTIMTVENGEMITNMKRRPEATIR